MNSSRKVVFVLLIAAMLGIGVVSPAAAAPLAPQPTLTCDGGTCQLATGAGGLGSLLALGANLALGQVPFTTTADGNTQATLDAQKELKLSLPIGEITLTNARLQVEVGQDGKIKRLNGSADMPFPTFGLLNESHVVTPARANVGLDLGKNLPDTGIQLVPDRPYLFFNANSFLDVAGRTTSNSDEFALSFVPGQRLTLVVDTVDPVAYLNGKVTLSFTDQIALLGGLLENTPAGPYIPDSLPLRERTQYGLNGKFSKDLAESRLTLTGGYMLDAGFLPASLGIDAQFVNLLGQLTLSQDGVLVDGQLKSAIEPDKVFDGSVRVSTFIAFANADSPSYASVDAGVAIPAAKLGVGGAAKASAGKYEVSGHLATPFRDSELAARASGNLPNIAGTVGPAISQAAGSVGATAGNFGGKIGAGAGKATAAAGAFVGPVAGKVAGFVGSYARLGAELAGNAIQAGKAKLNPSAGATVPEI